MARMPRVIAAAVLATVVVSGAGGCALGGCPTALAEGVLVADGEALVIRQPHGVISPIEWPDGYTVRREASGLVLTDFLGSIRAREGDLIRAGGGEGSSGRFEACGDVVVVPD
jgi:hypothetical protein